jgi:hypothetical protein
MENHTKYGEAIYFHGEDELYVNLFIPSELTWKEKGMVLQQKTDYPNSPETELTFVSAPSGPLALLLRCPAWATGPLIFQLNGQPLAVDAPPGRFARIQRTWSKGDRLTVTIPMGLRTEPLPDAPNLVAILYGPLLLAGDFGPVPRTATYPWSAEQPANDNASTVDVPFMVVDNADSMLRGVRRVPGGTPVFETSGIGRPKDVTLRPFKDLFYEYYNVYWTLLSPADWSRRAAELEKAAEEERADAARIVDDFSPGEQQSEVDHGFTSARSNTGDFRDRKYRDAASGGYFAFQLKVLPGTAQTLRCVYWGGDDGKRTFDIFVDGKVIATETLNKKDPDKFHPVEYPLPNDLLAGKDKITVCFQPHDGNTAGGIFGCAVLKKTLN